MPDWAGNAGARGARIQKMSQTDSARKRVTIYIAIGAFLFIGYFLLRGLAWQGTKQLHTIMEIVATLLASAVGVLALIRFYTKKNNTILFIGMAFLGAAFLDGYHAVVTSSFFDIYFPSAPSSLLPWSWIASRLFLSVFLVLSYLAWRREETLGEEGRIGERTVYSAAAAATLASFIFFAFVPLPKAYFFDDSNIIRTFHRPEEFFPAIFFILALIGYLKKGEWKSDPFEHWLVMSIIVGFMSQVMFMSISHRLFDLQFDAAHLLKKVSYVFVLTGLLISMSRLFRQAEKTAAELEVSSAELRDINERLEIVDRIAKVSGSSLVPEELFRVIAAEIRKAVPYDRCVIAHVSPHTTEHVYWYTESDVEISQQKIEDIPDLGPWFSKNVYESKMPVYISDIQASGLDSLKMLGDAGLRSTALIPILQDGKCTAHLGLHSISRDAFSKRQLDFLMDVASIIGHEIRVGELLRETRPSSADTEARQVVGFDGALGGVC